MMNKLFAGKSGLIMAGIIFLGAALMAGAAIMLFSAESPAPLDPVTLQLKWYHQAQFAGFYTAREAGLYEDEGIKTTFLEGGPDVDVLENLVSGKADFAVFSPENLLRQISSGVPVKAVAAIYRLSALVFAAREDSGIVRPDDFPGKTFAIGGFEEGLMDFQLQFKALMKKLDLDSDSVKIVPFDPEFSTFFSGKVDVTPVYYTGGLIKLRKKGLNPNLIWPGDYGVRFYSDLLVTTEHLINENPELVMRFVKASLKGWEKALGEPKIAVKTVLKYSRIKNTNLQKAMLSAMMPLIHTGRNRIGHMEPAIWENMYEILLEEGLLDQSFDVEKAYTLTFLDTIFEETDQ